MAVFLVCAFGYSCNSGGNWGGDPSRGLWEGQEPLPLRLVLEQVYGADVEPEEAVLGSIGDIAADNDGGLYVFDDRSARLVAFDETGAVRWRVGQMGEGPGDFSDSASIAFDGDATLYVSSGEGTRVDLWSAEGAYKETIPLSAYDLPRQGWVVGFLRPSRLVLTSRLPGRLASQVSVLDLSLPATPAAAVSFVIEAGPFVTPPQSTAAPPIEICTGDGLILAGNLGAYSLSSFDQSGRRVRVVTRPVDYLRLPGVATIGHRSSGRTFGFLSAPVVVEGEYWLAQASWPTNVGNPNEAVRRLMTDPTFEVTWASSLDLFDADGRLLLSIVEDGARMASIGRLALGGADGRLYTVLQDPFPQVRRYRVEIDAR